MNKCAANWININDYKNPEDFYTDFLKQTTVSKTYLVRWTSPNKKIINRFNAFSKTFVYEYMVCNYTIENNRFVSYDGKDSIGLHSIEGWTII